MANNAFNKSFEQSFSIGQQKGADLAQERLRFKLKQEEKLAEEERELSRNSDKLKAIIEAGTYDDIADKATLIPLAERIGKAGGSQDDLNKVIEGKIIARQSGREERFAVLQAALEKRNVSAQQGFSTEFTPEEIAAANIEGINIRGENALERLTQRINNTSEAGLAQSLKLVRTPGIEKATEFTIREAERELNTSIKEIQRDLSKLALAEADRSDKAATRPTLEEREAVVSGDFNLFPEPGQIGGLFREGGTGKKFLGIGKRAVTPEDTRVQAIISRIRTLDGEQAALDEALKDGVSEQEVKAVMREFSLSRNKALKRLGISEDQINKESIR